MVFKYDLAFIALFVCVLNVVNGGLENSTISSSSSSSSFSSSSSSSSSSTSTEPRSVSCDYKYEIFNPKTDKCECKEGFSGWGCQMCDSNLACQGIDKNYQCVNGLIYKKHSDHKTYACELDPSIQSLLSDGALAVKCDRTTGNCSVAIFKKKETVVGEHIIDCSLTTCKFEDDSSDGSCGLIECKCGKSCSTLTKQIVEKSLSGKPVKITAQNNTLNIEIQDFLTPLAAICKASACEISDSSGSGSSSGGSHGWSKGLLIAVITCAATAGIVLVCVLGCSCFVSTRILHDQKDVEDPRPLSSMPGRVLEFNQLSCRAYVKEGKNKPSREKLILQNINGKVTRGSVLGLLGPSGSGKTSLLNALAAVENGKSTFTGEILIDQQRISRDYRKIASYVQQDDSLYSTLTVRECIQYSAQLRLPSTMSQAAKEVMVDRVIDELNLTHVTNSRIGSSGTARGISGGERRRVSIGMELVTSPMILFLDEPTSGLDSSSSNSVVQLVKELANHGRIVVLSIHQPSSKAFHLLDQIMLLAKGQVLYYGAPKGAKDHFEKLGFICPENENTADFILDVATDPENIPLLRAKREETHLSHAFGMSETSLFINPSNADDNSMKYSGLSSVASTLTLLSPNASGSSSADRHESPSRRKSWKKAKSSRSSYVEIQVLFRRTAQNIYRHRSLLMLHVILSITLGLFGGLIFNHVTNDLAGFQNRSGAFYFILTFFGFSSMSSMDLFITERPIFLRETGAMYYGAFSYFLAKATLDAISLRILPATIFACIFYWIMGLQSSIDHFLVFIVTLILFNVAAGSISILIGVISRSAGAANLSGTVVFMIMLLFGGFLLNAQAMPTYVAWLKHFSIFSYAFEILMTNELKGLLINFNAPGYPSIPVYGDVFLKTLGMNYENRFYDMIALSVIAIALQMLSFLFLSLQVPPRSEIFLEDDSSSTENDAEPY